MSEFKFEVKEYNQGGANLKVVFKIGKMVEEEVKDIIEYRELYLTSSRSITKTERI